MMRVRWLLLAVFPLVVATQAPIRGSDVQPTALPWDAPLSAFWEHPADLPDRDLFQGPWPADHAPDAAAEYVYVRPKHGGVNPGVVVTDPQGREWHVKQASHSRRGAEGPVEVVLSRVLSALGYHQPPVYFLRSFTMRDASGLHKEPGGRFRLHDASMKARGEWSWEKSPFVGMRPYQGLLVILLAFDSFDLKNSNNTLYDVTRNGQQAQWYVVRDLGGALGESGKFMTRRNNPDRFAANRFITGVEHGFVVFDYHGNHGDVVRHRITPDDVGWAAHWLSQLSDRQWQDAFRAGGYDPAVASRFIATLQSRIAASREVGGTDWPAGD
jgi:hypothetical protein